MPSVRFNLTPGARVHPDRVLTAHTGAVARVALTPDGAVAVSASFDRTAVVWDVRAGVRVAVLDARAGAVVACAVASDARVVATAGEDGGVRVWVRGGGAADAHADADAGGWGVARVFARKPFAEAVECALGGDGEVLVAAWGDGEEGGRGVVAVYDWRKRRERRAWDVGGAVRSVAVCADASVVAVAWARGLREGVHVYDARTGATLRALPAADSPLTRVAVDLDPAGARLAICDDAGLRLCHVRRDAPDVPLVPRQQMGDGHGCRVSAACRYVVCTGVGDMFQVWDVNAAAKVATLGYDNGTRACAISADGSVIVTGAFDGIVNVYRMDFGMFTDIGASPAEYGCKNVPPNPVVEAPRDGVAESALKTVVSLPDTPTSALHEQILHDTLKSLFRVWTRYSQGSAPDATSKYALRAALAARTIVCLANVGADENRDETSPRRGDDKALDISGIREALKSCDNEDAAAYEELTQAALHFIQGKRKEQ